MGYGTNEPASPAMQRKMKMHVAYDGVMHHIMSRREIDNAPRGYHNTIVITLCGIDICYERHEEKQVLFDPAQKPLSCIICIAET